MWIRVHSGHEVVVMEVWRSVKLMKMEVHFPWGRVSRIGGWRLLQSGQGKVGMVLVLKAEREAKL